MSLSPQELRDAIAAVARELGLDAFGVAHADTQSEDRNRLLEWLTRGYHATMSWMARQTERRSDIQALLPGAKSVVVVALNYYRPETPNECCGELKISRYAWGEDYHRVLTGKLRELQAHLERLAPGTGSVTYVDTGPIMEKAWAQRAGIGWIGKNACLVTRELGSWVFLGEIITTAEITPDLPHTDFCGSCTRCLEACPTDAFPAPYVLDANRCISYWTIEHRGEFPDGVAADFDGWIFGCDVCQEVCPWNKFSRPTQEPAFAPRRECLCPPAERWASLSPEDFQKTFADSPIRRANPDGLSRNIRSQTANPFAAVVRSLAAPAPTAPE